MCVELRFDQFIEITLVNCRFLAQSGHGVTFDPGPLALQALKCTLLFCNDLDGP